MSNELHHYQITLTWTDNLGKRTSGYRDYGQEHRIGCHRKPTIEGSSDPIF